MSKPTVITYREARQELSRNARFVGKRRAFNAVVFQLADDAGKIVRSIVARTTSDDHLTADGERVRRTALRLQRLGFQTLWSAQAPEGLGGTVRMIRR